MDLPHYLIAPSALNYMRRIEVTNIVQAALFGHISPSKQEVLIPVTLLPDQPSGTWRVRSVVGVIGEIAPEIRQSYPDIARVTGSGFQPETIAGVRTDESDGQFHVDVFMPQPDLAVPRNNSPGGVPVLPPGGVYMVDAEHGEFPPHQLAELCPGQWLVGLTEVGGEIVASLNSRVLGTITTPGRDGIRNIVRTAVEQTGSRTVAARGYFVDGAVALDAMVPQNDCEQVFSLSVPDTRPAPSFHLVEYPDGTWAVTVEPSAAVDPTDITEPVEEARSVESPMTENEQDHAEESAAQPEPTVAETDTVGPDSFGPDSVGSPEPEQAATQEPAATDLPATSDSTPAHTVASGQDDSFDGRYLTEIEKVRARRARRATGQPRHAAPEEDDDFRPPPPTVG
ncbi:hypothetical protein QP027_03855 [Corynebacterium breve]|uniref:DUF3710 domain-containing protein n=1 Tax=Corynebacterium breve TaxID=3049799 RepID=A0ABY8VK18_9CORY|nr:hypothetical protein [Corynebacterium breve]WIM68539.1 hypothetical protein QP027_03855 [Corynebacterium breve]